jgi:hypothetical protein
MGLKLSAPPRQRGLRASPNYRAQIKSTKYGQQPGESRKERADTRCATPMNRAMFAS